MRSLETREESLMNMRSAALLPGLAFGLSLAGIVSAHGPAASAPAPGTQPAATTASLGMPVYVRNIDPAAAGAVKVVDMFSAAIKAARLDEAAKLLDPKVLILESGGSERSRDEYLEHHAIADAAFMQSAQQQLRYRQAHVDGAFAWVGTESELQAIKDTKPVLLKSTETMLLHKGPQGWKIVHIHWSSSEIPKK
jgi:hypothetical protein